MAEPRTDPGAASAHDPQQRAQLLQDRPHQGPLLVIGLGNPLRGDDAAGRLVADRLDRRQLPGILVRSVHQVVPELVEDLARCSRVVFVDASPFATEIQLHPLTPGPGPSRVTHHASPEQLLDLAASVGVPVPPAVLIAVPADDLALGEAVSTRTRRGVRVTVEILTAMARTRAPRGPGMRRPGRPMLARPGRLAGKVATPYRRATPHQHANARWRSGPVRRAVQRLCRPVATGSSSTPSVRL